MTGLATGKESSSRRLRAALSDAQVSPDLLPVLAREEQAAIATALRPVLVEAFRWCDVSPISHRRAVLPVALLMCLQFPCLAPAQVALRVKSSLWVYALDDAIDGVGPRERGIEAVLAECLTVARSGRNVGTHELPASLATLRAELQEQPGWHSVFPYWLRAFERLIAAMRREREARQELQAQGFLSAGLSLDEYLGFASYSIDVPGQWLAGLAMVSDGEGGLGDPLPDLFALAVQCGRAMRLANDLATWQREEFEGGINAVQLAQWSLGQIVPERGVLDAALQLVRDRLRREMAICRKQAVSVLSALAVAERFVRGTEVGVHLYSVADLRLWPNGLIALSETESTPQVQPHDGS